MKKTFLTLAIVIASYYSFAQSRVITTGNNVVNTSDPTAADVVVGSSANGGIRHDGSIMWWSNVSASRISNTADIFYLSQWVTTTPNIALNAIVGGSSYFQGNLGILTSNPLNTLQIGTQTGNATPTPLTLSLGGTFSNTAGANPKLKLYDDGVGPYGFGISNSQIDAIVPSGGNFAWFEGGVQKMILNSSGNFGIGTSSPQYKLDVQGGNASVYNNGAASNLVVGSGINGKTYIMLSTSADAGGYGTIQSVAASYLTYGNTAINPAGGNVLIGKTTQANSGYILDINGNVRANQVVINSTGADFVFAPTYHLNSLTNVKKYIDKNHHLPEIASAKEMQTNGLNVGENQTKLLQKVEELTLYLIDENNTNWSQQDKIKQLSERLESQQNEIDELKSQVKAFIRINSK